MRVRSIIGAAAIAAAVLAGPSAAELPVEEVGKARVLPAEPGPHWFWLSDVLLHRTALFDADSGELLGSITSGSGGVGFVISPMFSRERGEIYIPETYFSRGTRGERTDVVTIYDARTLAPKDEIVIPAKRAEYFPGNAANAISDDGRFVAVFNLTPATSLTIVDVVEREVVGEVPAAGCGLVYAAGPKRFFMLCANGEALVVDVAIGEEGGPSTAVSRTEAFFEAFDDPLTEKAVRSGDTWYFVSFSGDVQTVDVGGDELAFGEPWPLLSSADRKENWRVGGGQHLAVHPATNRLYVLVHQGEEDTHKVPGTEAWVYDVERKKRIRKIALENPLVSFLGSMAGLGDWARTIVRWVLPHPGVDRILVTPDDDPVLVASSTLPPAITIHDAMTGEVRGEISEPGFVGTLLFSP